MKIRTKSA